MQSFNSRPMPSSADVSALLQFFNRVSADTTNPHFMDEVPEMVVKAGSAANFTAAAHAYIEERRVAGGILGQEMASVLMTLLVRD